MWLVLFKKTCRGGAEQCHVLDIYTAFRLVQHDEGWVLHYLAAVKSCVDVAVFSHMYAFGEGRYLFCVDLRGCGEELAEFQTGLW